MVDFIEPNILNGKIFEHQIKGTLGITELYWFSVHSDINGCDLDVDLSYPCDVAVANGSTVRRVKWYMNWVQNGESQFGFYLNLMLNYQNFTLYEKIGKKKPIVIGLLISNKALKQRLMV